MGSIPAEQKHAIGFVGLGAMGFGMASNLLKDGFDVTGYDLNLATLERFGNLGGSVAKTICAASKGKPLFFLMVATPEQVDSVMFTDKDGAIFTLPQRAIVCIFSTLHPSYVTGLPQRLAAYGRSDISLLDCPVSGGMVGAINGTLSIMLGGDDSIIQQVEPALKAVSAPNRLFRCGPLGSASAVKMLNQHLAGIHVVVAAETLAFAKAVGLSSRDAHKILMESAASSWIMGDRGRNMLDANWTPRSAVSIFVKDMGIVNEVSDQLEFSCPIASAAYLVFLERLARGNGGLDDASVVCNYEDVTGTPVFESQRDETLTLESDIPVYPGISTIFIAETDSTSSILVEATNSLTVISPDNSEKVMKRLNGLADKSLVGLCSLDNYIGIGENISTDDDYAVIIQHLKSVLPLHIKPVPIQGGLGSASKMYAVVRLASLVHIVATAECYSLARARGVSCQLVYDLIAGAAGSSTQFNHFYLDMLHQTTTEKSQSGLDTFGEALADLQHIKRIMRGLKFPGRLLDAAHQVFKGTGGRYNIGNASVAAVVDFWEGGKDRQ
nr:ketose-bisphosphate aldolase class-II family protein [Colletotrichum truncatum]KAF6784901.1 ketose-bisphosphate aldolase class-II family protein [Colletotrichum truncatum]